MTETAAIVPKQSRIVTPQLIRPQQQLREVHYAVTGAGLFIVDIQLDELPARGIVVVLEALRPTTLVLVRIDEPLHLARYPAALVQVARLDEFLDEALLVLGIEDLKTLHETRLAPVETQQPMGEPVERADPQRAAGYSQQRLDPAPHFTGSLVRERHGQNAVRRDVLRLNQPRDPIGQHARLAAPGAGEDQHGTERSGDRFALRFVQRIEEGGQVHAGRIVPCRLATPDGVQRSPPRTER